MQNDKIIIVGSSDSMLEKDLGSKIDEFETIVRFNRAPTLGFERHVGSKTTHRFCNSHVVINDFIQGQDMQFLSTLRNQMIITDNKNAARTFHRIFHESCSLETLNRNKEYNELINRLGLSSGGIQPSVGLGAICYYLNRGKDITIYGFHIHSTEGKSSPHYWWDKKGVGGHHNFNYERTLIKKILQLDLIKYLS